MKKVSLILAVILLLSTFLCACGGNPLVGTWTGTQDGITVSMTFNDDGTCSMSAVLFTINYTYTAENGVIKLVPDESSADLAEEAEMNYEIKGDTLVLENDGETLELTKSE